MVKPACVPHPFANLLSPPGVTRRSLKIGPKFLEFCNDTPDLQRNVRDQLSHRFPLCQSKDVIRSACRQITRLWWNRGRLDVASYISPYVVEEASAGDTAAAAERIKALRTLPVLPITPEIPALAEFFLLGGGLPAKARLDALHIACAAYHQIDILVTWNCTHIANPA